MTNLTSMCLRVYGCQKWQSYQGEKLPRRKSWQRLMWVNCVKEWQATTGLRRGSLPTRLYKMIGLTVRLTEKWQCFRQREMMPPEFAGQIIITGQKEMHGAWSYWKVLGKIVGDRTAKPFYKNCFGRDAYIVEIHICRGRTPRKDLEFFVGIVVETNWLNVTSTEIHVIETVLIQTDSVNFLDGPFS